MDDNKYRKFYVDWWNIRRSTIYGLIALGLFGGLIIYGSWYASKNNWFLAADSIDIPKDAARIVSFEGEVRITRAATRETIIVTKETYVTAGDTIQTQADGRAVIQMIDGSVYSVRPNSTVVVRDTTSLFGGKNVRVRVDDGQLNVRTEDQPADSKNIVELGESENQLQAKTDASFSTSGPDGGEIRISRGGVETTLGGEKTLIGENEFATVNGSKLSARERLLAPPRLGSPANSEQIVDSSGGGVTVNFSWQDPDGNPAASFYLQISKSSTFVPDSIMVDRSGMTSRDFKLAGLSPGAYYWRVKATARSGQTTNWSDPSRFNVVKSGGNVAIDASEWKVEGMGGGIYLISGRTTPGMIVRAAERETFAGSDGSFKLQISSPSTELAVEIGDDRGNRSGFVLSLRSGNMLRRY
ncbi:MAG: FecR domain-containing protein [Pyrinomonadaceae bacterium]|nr:FecR domain-containing protein [Acidobacteriota bacterium]MBP7375484.1 FecR domain-containing protein [Pyrinomonadaceae bacterium]